MSEATFDAIIIGAGHNGIALGTYLAKSGWDVAIFEKRAEEGGGLCTEELTRPGFLHNVHCNYHTLVGVCPVYEDLELFRHGLRYVRPPVQMGSVFADGTALTVHTDLDKTCASIARFSPKDAETFRRFYEESRGYLDLILLPQYRAAEFDPDIDQAWVVNVGYETPADLNRHWQDVRSGLLPDPKPNCAVNSLFDATDAPEGCYTGLMRHFAPYGLSPGGAEAWDRVARDYGRRCIERWQAAAPNLGDGAILEWATYTPLDISRRIPNMIQGDWMGGLVDLSNLLDRRPSLQLSQYQTPIRGLYLCGATQHPHGFVTFAPAYNALEVIAADHAVERWWR